MPQVSKLKIGPLTVYCSRLRLLCDGHGNSVNKNLQQQNSYSEKALQRNYLTKLFKKIIVATSTRNCRDAPVP